MFWPNLDCTFFSGTDDERGKSLRMDRRIEYARPRFGGSRRCRPATAALAEVWWDTCSRPMYEVKVRASGEVPRGTSRKEGTTRRRVRSTSAAGGEGPVERGRRIIAARDHGSEMRGTTTARAFQPGDHRAASATDAEGCASFLH